MNKIETIREACIKANPDIVYLKRGCELILKEEHKGGSKHTVLVDEKNGVMWADAGMVIIQIWGDDIKEIIGRPIRLADVLHGIQTKIAKQWLDTSNPLETLGKWQPHLEKTGLEIIKKWRLLEDDLTQQSDETIDFLYNLLSDLTGESKK